MMEDSELAASATPDLPINTNESIITNKKKEKKTPPANLVIPPKKPKMSKAERRALQEAQRLAKAGGKAMTMKTAAATTTTTRTFDMTLPPKTVYLIRHGQSLGQKAGKRGFGRHNMILLDCDLTNRGKSEALHLTKIFSSVNEEGLQEDSGVEHDDDAGDDGGGGGGSRDSSSTAAAAAVEPSIQLVISSPMTRALHTALLGFPHHPILIHYDLKEQGSKIPENIPRPIEDVLKDLEYILEERDVTMGATVDYESLQPEGWPHRYNPDIHPRNLIKQAFQWLYHDRIETNIAVVCHYNVIRTALVGSGSTISPENATPICCQLYPNGDLVEAVVE